MVTVTVVLAAVLLLGAATEAGKKVIPSYVHVCKKNDPNFDSCVLKSVDSLRPHLLKGIPKMHVPPYDPLVIPALDVVRDLEALKVKASMKDITAYGANGFVVDKFKTDIEGLSVEMAVTLPKLYATCEYDVDGQLLVVPLKGKGFFKGNFTDVKVQMSGKGKIVTKDDVKYVEATTIKAKLSVGGSEVDFGNHDNSTRAIAESAANFINQNMRQVLDVVRPVAEETVEEVALQIANSIFLHLPYDEILPE
ncbi:circadian clock-controlled protein daywake [Anabrus simplex]|uniref:circadian clock-controlled protein daywake n=1 Tax=Anabrus simplex TaxID=316456 RepID=UPI0035A35AEE